MNGFHFEYLSFFVRKGFLFTFCKVTKLMNENPRIVWIMKYKNIAIDKWVDWLISNPLLLFQSDSKSFLYIKSEYTFAKLNLLIIQENIYEYLLIKLIR